MPQYHRTAIRCAASICVTLVLLCATVSAQTTATMFVDVDAAPDSTVEGVVDDLQKVVILCATPDQSTVIRLMSLHSTGGEQVGEVVDVELPPSPCFPPEPIYPPDPIRVLYSRYFLPGNVLVLHANHVISYEHILLSRQGTPLFDSWSCLPPLINPVDVSAASAIGEMPGEAFGDGKPRLLVGTERGELVVIVMSDLGGPTVERVIADLVPPEPIQEIKPIMMASGDIHAGIGTGVDIYGMLDIGAGAAAPSIGFWCIPEVGDEVLVSDFGFFHDPVSGTTPDDDHEFIITDGTSPVLTLASFASDAAGQVTYSVIRTFPPEPVTPVARLATGSLLTVSADSTAVYYDPAFDSVTGPSGCALEITDGDPSGCACCVGGRGDMNGDSVDADPVDLSYLVDFLFAAGASPLCAKEADVNGDGTDADPIDLAYLVDFLFGGGALPAVCP